MLFWSIAIAVTAIACAAIYYAAAGRSAIATPAVSEDNTSDFRVVLAGIDADLASGKLGEAEATAAKAELAREVIRLKADSAKAKPSNGELGQGALFAGLGGVAVLSLGVYFFLGQPNMPSLPLAERSEVAAQSINLDDAIARIEQQLAANPDDLRGWTVIAPAYRELGRYADAAHAFQRIIELGGATPDLQTNEAEALLLAADGAGSPAAMDLLRAAAESDPTHVLSRLYLAAELTRTGKYPEAIAAWEGAIKLSNGNEPWLSAAQSGLQAAQNDGVVPNAVDDEMIQQMVTGLAERLSASGGTIEEWTQLVRAYLVLGDRERAQAAVYDALAAYPLTFDRGDLDAVALGAGLDLDGAKP